jgi:sortase A
MKAAEVPDFSIRGNDSPQPRRGRWIRTVILMATLAIGLWQAGEGLWIYGKAHLAQVLLHRAWARALAGEREPKAWPWADTWPVARLRHQRLGIDLVVLANASGSALAFGPAHVADTPMPGRQGTTVMTGHRDTHFAFLRRVRFGDLLWIDTPDGRTTGYIVRETAVIDGRTGAIVSGDSPRLALVTCYPFDAIVPGGPSRFVVVAEQWYGRSLPGMQD